MKKNHHVCDHCGKRFLPRISRQRFCATGCRQAWASLNDKRKNHKGGRWHRYDPATQTWVAFVPPPSSPPPPSVVPDVESGNTLDRLLAVLRFARDAGFEVVVREHVNGGIVAELELRGDR